MNAMRILLAGTALLALFATVALVAKPDCAGATGDLCKRTMMKGNTEVTIIEVTGNIRASNQGPCKTTIRSAAGSVTTKARGAGKSSRCGTLASGNGNTVYTATVEGRKCGPTQTDSKKESDIPDC